MLGETYLHCNRPADYPYPYPLPERKCLSVNESASKYVNHMVLNRKPAGLTLVTIMFMPFYFFQNVESRYAGKALTGCTA